MISDHRELSRKRDQRKLLGIIMKRKLKIISDQRELSRIRVQCILLGKIEIR